MTDMISFFSCPKEEDLKKIYFKKLFESMYYLTNPNKDITISPESTKRWDPGIQDPEEGFRK